MLLLNLNGISQVKSQERDGNRWERKEKVLKEN